jgi:hypothetical protein
MAQTTLDRLLYEQGGRCFFCQALITRSEASVEHLLAVKHGGTKADGNCVACCKSLNSVLGSHTLREKFRIILSQPAPFRCPRDTLETTTTLAPPQSDLDKVISNLRKREGKLPKDWAKLHKTVSAVLQNPPAPTVDTILAQLRERGLVHEDAGELKYSLDSD